MNILTLAAGSKFEIDGVVYRLTVVPADGGYNWLGEDGKYKLTQHFYSSGSPTIETLERMKKYLVV